MVRTSTNSRDARSERVAEQAKREKACLVEVDKAATRLSAAQQKRDKVAAKAEAVVADAARAHERAVADYARCAGVDRAAYVLGVDEREVRRLLRVSESPPPDRDRPGR